MSEEPFGPDFDWKEAYVRRSALAHEREDRLREDIRIAMWRGYIAGFLTGGAFATALWTIFS